MPADSLGPVGRCMVNFVKTTLIGGVVFLLPAALILIVIGKALGFAKAIAGPISDKLPQVVLFGAGTASLVAILLLVTICFLAGMFARTSVGHKIRSSVDTSIISHIPAYQMLKSMVEGMAEIQSSGNVRSGLARIEDAWQPALVLEELGNGLFTVFVPQAPTPMSGSIFYLTADRVKMLDVPISRVLMCVRKMGLGSQALLGGRTDLR